MSWMRSSGGVSIRMRVPPSLSTYAPTRVRLSRGSVERQTSHRQPICGTPKLVPVPRKVSFTRARPRRAASHALDLERVRRSRLVERDTGRDQDAVARVGELASPRFLEADLHHLVVA